MRGILKMIICLVIFLTIILLELTSCEEMFNSSHTSTTTKPQHEHLYIHTDMKLATCTEKGYLAYVCDCGEKYISTFYKPTGHSFGEWKVINKPTETEEGLWERYCESCGEKESKTIPAQTPSSEGLEFESFWHPNKGVWYTVIGIGTCTDEDLVIPATYDGCPVVSVYGLENCTWIKSITIQEGVEGIGANAFKGCTSLVSIDIPSSVNSIGYSAFGDCSSLESIEFPNGITVIQWGMFSNCTSLKNIIIPETVTTIERNAFQKCTALESIVIPDSVTVIEDYSFSNCSSLKNITLSKNLTEMSINLFSGCTALESIEIPDSVTILKNSAFSGCTSLKNIIFGGGLMTIEQSVFNKCSSLVSIDIPNGVTEIGSGAFGYCNSLQSVTIPDSVVSIDNTAFRNCNALESITVSEGNKSYKSIDGILYTKDGKTLILSPKSNKNTSVVLPEGLEVINASSFDENKKLESIEIPNTVKNIKMYAFRLCESLRTITFNGTIDQWQGITKESGWDNGLSKYTIYCTNGTISWLGEVTYYEN